MVLPPAVLVCLCSNSSVWWTLNASYWWGSEIRSSRARGRGWKEGPTRWSQPWSALPLVCLWTAFISAEWVTERCMSSLRNSQTQISLNYHYFLTCVSAHVPSVSLAENCSGIRASCRRHTCEYDGSWPQKPHISDCERRLSFFTWVLQWIGCRAK